MKSWLIALFSELLGHLFGLCSAKGLTSAKFGRSYEPFFFACRVNSS
jgi:hypothetical protein